MIFFISDLHFGHKNIIKYCERPFKDIDEMDETLIYNWNLSVDATDEIYIIGDLSFRGPEKTGQILDRLKGRKTLIKGNHDKKLVKKHPYILSERGIDVYDLLEIAPEIDDKKQPITLCHYPMQVWNHSHEGSWMLHGHSHGTLDDDHHLFRMDVGVDAGYNYFPVSLDLVKYQMSQKEWKPVDYHGTR